jgi:hypothetical protein
MGSVVCGEILSIHNLNHSFNLKKMTCKYLKVYLGIINKIMITLRSIEVL